MTTVAELKMATEVCCTCGMAFAMPLDYQTRRKNDHDWFYCPAGHAQHYNVKSDVEKLHDKLAQAAKDREYLEAELKSRTWERDYLQGSARAYKGQVTMLKKRAAAGVCPCCNRHFTALERHMAEKHPGYAVQEPTAE